MRLHLTAKRLDITPDLEARLTRHLDRLRPRLRHFAPDLVRLDLALRRHPRKQEYCGISRYKARLRRDQALPVTQTAPIRS